MNELKKMRLSVGLTQDEFSSRMGMPLRTYEGIERGHYPIKPIHIKAANWAVHEIHNEAVLEFLNGGPEEEFVAKVSKISGRHEAAPLENDDELQTEKKLANLNSDG